LPIVAAGAPLTSKVTVKKVPARQLVAATRVKQDILVFLLRGAIVIGRPMPGVALLSRVPAIFDRSFPAQWITGRTATWCSISAGHTSGRTPTQCRIWSQVLPHSEA
jgi:hypothetical protein